MTVTIQKTEIRVVPTTAGVIVTPTAQSVAVSVASGLTMAAADARYALISGGAADRYYRHVQSVAAATWTITHNLGKYPSVSMVDSAGDKVYGHVHYDSTSQVTITISAAMAGEAYCN